MHEVHAHKRSGGYWVRIELLVIFFPVASIVIDIPCASIRRAFRASISSANKGAEDRPKTKPSAIDQTDLSTNYSLLIVKYNVVVKRRKNAQRFYVRWRAAGPELKRFVMPALPK